MKFPLVLSVVGVVAAGGSTRVAADAPKPEDQLSAADVQEILLEWGPWRDAALHGNVQVPPGVDLAKNEVKVRPADFDTRKAYVADVMKKNGDWQNFLESCHREKSAPALVIDIAVPTMFSGHGWSSPLEHVIPNLHCGLDANVDAMIAKIKVIHVKLASVAFVKKAQAGDQDGWEMAWNPKAGTYTVGVFSGERNDGDAFRAWAARQ